MVSSGQYDVMKKGLVLSQQMFVPDAEQCGWLETRDLPWRVGSRVFLPIACPLDDSPISGFSDERIPGQ